MRQTEEIKRLKEKLAERENASKKNVDQMEELHENLAELDARFERSEEQNKTLKCEKEELVRKNEDETEERERQMVKVLPFSDIFKDVYYHKNSDISLGVLDRFNDILLTQTKLGLTC